MTVLGFAHLQEPALQDVRDLEEKHGIVLLAYEKPPEPADLTQDQLIKIQELEQTMGCRLIAYR